MSELTDKFVGRVTSESNYGMLPEPTDFNEAIGILTDYLLGEDYIATSFPLSARQITTLLVDQILYEYSSRYRKDLRKIRKGLKS